jgi:lysophospholipid acyltransferase (LPLAT)-like uncharacterized protein
MDSRAERRARREAALDRAAAREAAGRNEPAARRLRRLRRRIGAWLLETFAPSLLRIYAWTWRVQRRGEAGLVLQRSTAPWIAAMWHGRMVAMMPIRGHRSRGFQVLVSPSEDGSLAQRALRRFGYRIVRGSLSRGGARALREMNELLAGGAQLVVTPDGPRGPRHDINVGIAWLARSSGVPILPVGIGVDRAWRLRSWDRFTIPKPFARLCVAYGEPIVVAADASDDSLEEVASRVRTEVLAVERAAFAQLGVADDHDL